MLFHEACVCLSGGGYPHPDLTGGVPSFPMGGGGGISQVWMGGYPLPRSGTGEGTPFQVRLGGYPLHRYEKWCTL